MWKQLRDRKIGAYLPLDAFPATSRSRLMSDRQRNFENNHGSHSRGSGAPRDESTHGGPSRQHSSNRRWNPYSDHHQPRTGGQSRWVFQHPLGIHHVQGCPICGAHRSHLAECAANDSELARRMAQGLFQDPDSMLAEVDRLQGINSESQERIQSFIRDLNEMADQVERLRRENSQLRENLGRQDRSGPPAPARDTSSGIPEGPPTVVITTSGPPGSSNAHMAAQPPTTRAPMPRPEQLDEEVRQLDLPTARANVRLLRQQLHDAETARDNYQLNYQELVVHLLRRGFSVEAAAGTAAEQPYPRPFFHVYRPAGRGRNYYVVPDTDQDVRMGENGGPPPPINHLHATTHIVDDRGELRAYNDDPFINNNYQQDEEEEDEDEDDYDSEDSRGRPTKKASKKGKGKGKQKAVDPEPQPQRRDAPYRASTSSSTRDDRASSRSNRVDRSTWNLPQPHWDNNVPPSTTGRWSDEMDRVDRGSRSEGWGNVPTEGGWSTSGPQSTSGTTRAPPTAPRASTRGGGMGGRTHNPTERFSGRGEGPANTSGSGNRAPPNPPPEIGIESINRRRNHEQFNGIEWSALRLPRTKEVAKLSASDRMTQIARTSTN